MKKISTIILSIIFTVSVYGQTTLFSDNFQNSNNWNITSGELIVSNNIASTQGNSQMTTAFADFSVALSSGKMLVLTFTSNDVTNFATDGWAGVSLYTGGETGTEQVFIGSPGMVSSWGISISGTTTSLVKTSEIGVVVFTYNYDTGAWTLNVDGETANGTMTSNLAFNAVRIGADIENLSDIAISNLSIVANSLTSIYENNASKVLVAYPNPTNGIINIDCEQNNIKRLTICDITGKKIIEKSEIPQNKQIDISSFESGIYFINLQTENEIFTTKIVKK